ncbi:hypothetical protein COCCADRAFT_98398 [Bipolaris zeicola 26-R-13]|uniref:Uncharacterized protein n=1 Tax=Cochliobolus carbonum (strain 26-R-13) TaxID=930089 RepID=W6YAP0_COCC2|nr:uncharacterized protein COCCADRAFT_98398 [Bipolaris zeicola 26-R-13]EUC32544.1 hypothetical protein COCCADRAFT_98398 [Bipolaris zeicola 26-R-13]
MPVHERRQDRTEAKIELAFPFDSITQQPKLSKQGQHIFAFLPLLRLAQLQVRHPNSAQAPANDET